MCMKRTNIELEEVLVKETMKLSGIKTIKGVVDFALKEYVRREKQLKLLDLQGAISWEGNLNESRISR